MSDNNNSNNNESFDDVASFDSRWRDDGLGWHGRRGADGDAAAENESKESAFGLATLGEAIRRYVEGYACVGNACSAGGLSSASSMSIDGA
mmetsp:Transcript_22898/g.55208  ORF Transcript_22898/g.55208 Transcript_22898/m.55208 type:complete len:91 (+) Transcript_22898:76-348(+)